ncbi:hypothetical protein WJX72_004427 [[Myrmecia] bisecta]|uniref:Potassium transporter n=1 Tax=[Myrmecia] bisecta TaxID=41462 RepID=A0AAW1QQ87_9CHLO
MAGTPKFLRASLSRSRAKVQRVLGRVTTGRWEQDADLPQTHGLQPSDKGYKRAVLLLAYQAVGVVYGDLGTSPLYTFASVFTSVEPTEANIIGALSLVIYTFTMIVVIKYAMIVLWADDYGQGGTFALYSVLKRYFEGLKDEKDKSAVAAADLKLAKYSRAPSRSASPHLWSLSTRSLRRRPSAKSSQPGGAAGLGPRGHRSMMPLGLNKAGAVANDGLVSGRLSMDGISHGHRATVGTLDTPRVSPKDSPLLFAETPRAQEAGKAELRSWRDWVGSRRSLQLIVRIMVVIGVGAIMGDGVLTPAISVVSAIEGLQVGIPSISRGVIVGVSIAIIAALFLIQRFGTRVIGFAFSPIVVLWLCFNAIIGIYNIAKYNPGVFRAFGPNYWFAYFLRNGAGGWRSLGGVLLCITGSEALFADMGHFSRPAIQLSTLVLVWPSLLLTYLGQAAYLIKHPQDAPLAYFRALPGWTFWPMLVIATLAAIVASQALIAAVFSIVFQAIAQGFFPRFHVVHTSRTIYGQVYIPFINYLLMLLTLIVVGTFRTSEHIGRAYGLAVIVDMLFTTHFLTLVMLFVWRSNAAGVLAFYLIYVAIEGTYLSASVEKIPKGGWFSIMMAAIYASIMLLWFWGSTNKSHYFKKKVVDLERLLGLCPGPAGPDASMQDPEAKLCLVQGNGARVHRFPGVVCVYSEYIYGVPPVLTAQLVKFPAVHEVAIFLTNRFVPVPDVDNNERLLVEQLGVSGFYHCIARYGYMQSVDQGPEFVTFVLDNVLNLLYATLQQSLISNPALLHRLSVDDLGSVLRPLPEATPSFAIEENGIDPDTVVSVNATTSAEDSASGSQAQEGPSAHSTANAAVGIDGVYPARETQGNTEAPGAAPSATSARSMRSMHSAHSVGSSRSMRSMRAPSVRRSAGPQPMTNIAAAVRTFLDEVVVKLDGCGPLPAPFRPIQLLAKEILVVKHAQASAAASAVYMLGRTHARLRPDSNWLRRYLLEFPYQLLVNNLEMDASRTFGIPDERIHEIGMLYCV